MRILYFSRSYTPHDYRFLNSLSRTSHEIFFLQLENDARKLETRLLPERVKKIGWPGSRKRGRQSYPALRKAFKRILDEIKPDLVHAGPLTGSAFVSALAGVHPLVSMSWGSDILWEARHSRFMHWITRYTLNRSDVLVADCQAVAREAEKYSFPPERTVLFPWGVDLEHFQPGPAPQLCHDLRWEDCFVVLSLRSWEPLYGVDQLVKGFITAAQKYPDLRLLLLGSGSQANLLRSLVVEAGLQERVHFAGQVGQEDLPCFYQTADLYVSASHSDGSSVSLLEALASGVPVLVSDIEGNREWVEEGQQGWLFRDGNEQAIAAGICAAYESRDTHDVIRQAARKTAECRADWNANFQRLLAAYENAIATANRRATADRQTKADRQAAKDRKVQERRERRRRVYEKASAKKLRRENVDEKRK